MQPGPDEVRVGEDVAIDFSHSSVQVEQFRPLIFAPQKARSDSAQRIAFLDDVVGTAIALMNSIAGQRYAEDPPRLDDAGPGEALSIRHLSANVGCYQSRELVARAIELLGDSPQGVTWLHGVFDVPRSLAVLLIES